MDLRRLIRDVPDFPKPGIVFKDITPLLGEPGALVAVTDAIAAAWSGKGITKVVGIESRGFILAAPVAMRLGVGFVPVRKPGKLPWRAIGVDYDLEYGRNRVEMHVDALGARDRVLIVDDVLATGGTAAAAVALARQQGAAVAGLAVLVELVFLGGAARAGTPVSAVLRYEG